MIVINKRLIIFMINNNKFKEVNGYEYFYSTLNSLGKIYTLLIQLKHNTKK